MIKLKQYMLIVAVDVKLNQVSQGRGYLVKPAPYSHPGDRLIFFDREEAVVYARGKASIIQFINDDTTQYLIDGRIYATVQRGKDKRNGDTFWRLRFGYGNAATRCVTPERASQMIVERIATWKPDLVAL